MADCVVQNEILPETKPDEHELLATTTFGDEHQIAINNINFEKIPDTTEINLNSKSLSVVHLKSPQHVQDLLIDTKVDILHSAVEESSNEQIDDYNIATNTVRFEKSPDTTEISNLNDDLLSSNNIIQLKSHHIQNSITDTKVDVLHSAVEESSNEQIDDYNIATNTVCFEKSPDTTKISNLNDDLLSSNNSIQLQSPHHTQDPVTDTKVDVLHSAVEESSNEQIDDYSIATNTVRFEKIPDTTEISNLNDDSLSSNNIIQLQDPVTDTKLDALHSAVEESSIEQINGSNIATNSDNFEKSPNPTEISNLNDDSLSSNNVIQLQSPQHMEDSLTDTKFDVSPSAVDELPIKEIDDYKISDIVWAKIGKYPFWPSVVCYDPQSNTYIKRTKSKKVFLHVRFCNDKGRRSWTTFIENYNGKNDLLTKYPLCLSYIKNNQKLMKMWNLAVDEADNLLKFDGEARILEFFKTFLDSDELNCLTLSMLNNSSKEAISPSKVRTYSRKRSLNNSEQDNDSKLAKTEIASMNDCYTQSKSIDISLLSKSDDTDSTVSDISMIYTHIKTNSRVTKKKKSTKTYPPKSLYTNKYDLYDTIEYNDENNFLFDHDMTTMTSNSTRSVPEQRKLEISIVEDCLDDYINSPNSRRSKKARNSTKLDKSYQNANVTSHSLQSPSSSKKVITKRKLHVKESSIERKSIVKNESSPEPDSKSETYSTVFLASTKNKQLFVKNAKRACVVCKGVEDTQKCLGPCQNYFHKKCLAKSEERYKQDPIVDKRVSKRKRQYTKSTRKIEDSIDDIPQTEHDIHKENTDQVYINDNLMSKSPIEMKTLSEEQTVDDSIVEDESHDQTDSNSLSDNTNSIFVKNENTQELSELKNSSKALISKTFEDTVTDSSVRSINVKNNKLSYDIKHMCSVCKADKTYCFVCDLAIKDPEPKVVCKLATCGKYYHRKCLVDWPQCQWNQGSRNNVQCVICPHHVCHLCISDNPKSSCATHFPPEKLTRCIRCPTAYHRSEYCLPAGSEVLTYFDIICSRHYEPLKLQNYHFNATWCFICTLGGRLICCDLCPSSFHIECLKIDPSEFEGGFTCEECQTGRYPLYGEIVWAKIGNYRWWPAQIVFPNQVPDSVNAITHSVGQFAVRFFGTYDYYWVNRGRVFNFHEGDDENILRKTTMKVIDQVFQDATIEAAQAHNAYILDKDKKDAAVSKNSSTKPPKYTRIKFNKPFGNVKSVERVETLTNPCECDPNMPNPCGPDSDCINRMLMLECDPQVCFAGDKCNNQRFEKVLYPAMEPFLTKGRGWGLRTLEDIKEGSFVIEYVGDVIDEEEFQRRCIEMHKRNEQNYYFLTIDNTRTIDAGPKGNLSRFMNHSCEPNCVSQKWTVNGDTRIGLFALHDIPANTELVFDYRLQSCSGVEKKPCQCGAARCSKYIGVKVEEEKKKVISINDADKCKTTTRNKRKPLKLKDNLSDSDKSKLSKVVHNDQDISTNVNGIDKTNAEKTEDVSNKSKTKSQDVIKSEELESSETHADIKNKRKTSTRNSIILTKNDNIVGSLEFEETQFKSVRKQKNCLPTLPKQFTKDDTSIMNKSTAKNKKRKCKNFKKKIVTKTNSLSLHNKSTEVKATGTSYLSDGEGDITNLNDIEDMKSTRVSKSSIKNVTKTEKTRKLLENVNVIKTNESIETKVTCRHSLSRLAKSRHSFLSKNDIKKKGTIQKTVKQPAIESKKVVNKEKKTTPKIVNAAPNKHEEILLTKNIAVKQNNMNNKHKLQTYYKNDSCLVCGKGQAELACKNKKCPRVFHLSCMNKNKIFKSGFICPSHYCSVCRKRKVVAKCKFCVESFCNVHVKGNIFKDPLGHGMLCSTHHPDKKLLPIASTSVTLAEHITNKNIESIDLVNSRPTDFTISRPTDFANSIHDVTPTEALLDVDDQLINIETDMMNKEEYPLTQVIKDECDREYIHIGGFNVCHMSDLAINQGNSFSVPIDTDGDLFKPSSANVVIDIESASALYHSTDNLQLVSIATDNKDANDYANVRYLPDINQTKNKWLAAEP